MALLWIEGFEGFGDTIGAAPSPKGIIRRKYLAVTNEASMKIQTGRHGLGLEVGTGGIVHSPQLTTDRTTVIGGAVKVISTSMQSKIFTLYECFGPGINLRINVDGTLSVYHITTLLATSTLALNLSTWYYIEMKVYTIDNPTGTVDVRVNEADWINLSGIITQAGWFGSHDSFKLGECDVETWYDDIYFLDGTGTINNDFLGTRKVSVIRPNAAGDASQWTPDSGTNYDRVNEVELDEDTSYVETSASIPMDLYNYEPTINLTDVDGIQIMTEVRVTFGSRGFQTMTKSGPTLDFDSGGIITSTKYVTVSSVGELNPDTLLPWTPGEIDAAQFGIRSA